NESLVLNFVNWAVGCTLIYASMFGIGYLLFKEWLAGLVCLLIAMISAAVISRNLARSDWSEPPA
ncbi:MAG TPA: hypothetical protein VJ828_06490, partial [Lacipirellulaceae bacterium]|nr:hypothetical protein [Lacipirellulaceae bacterium]